MWFSLCTPEDGRRTLSTSSVADRLHLTVRLRLCGIVGSNSHTMHQSHMHTRTLGKEHVTRPCRRRLPRDFVCVFARHFQNLERLLDPHHEQPRSRCDAVLCGRAVHRDCSQTSSPTLNKLARRAIDARLAKWPQLRFSPARLAQKALCVLTDCNERASAGRRVTANCSARGINGDPGGRQKPAFGDIARSPRGSYLLGAAVSNDSQAET